MLYNGKSPFPEEKTLQLTDDGMELEKAIAEAVKYCEENNVLQSFLNEHASEVENMLTTVIQKTATDEKAQI